MDLGIDDKRMLNTEKKFQGGFRGVSATQA